jgi:hypothetical protein
MQLNSLSTLSRSESERARFSPRESFRLYRGRRVAAEPEVRTEASPMHSIQTFAATMFVMSAAVGWLAFATVATAPLIGAGELLIRATKAPDKPV